ncbi:hypothetical protein B0H11DRAFT_115657 [Mycena galericulata]|nr:hypothetical protein B0H11DRAFT_115657 [Mycena galericulata]
MPSVPQELLDIIINDLHDDVPSLKACSLASRVFVPSARVHIFSTIYLLPPRRLRLVGSQRQKNYSQKFDALLDKSPHLAPLVKDLRIVEGADVDELQLNAVFPGTPWLVASARTLISILSRLNLTRFSLLRKHHMHAVGVTWDDLPRRLAAAIHNVFRSPALESVRILGIPIAHPQAVISMLSDAHKLKELALEHTIVPPNASMGISPKWRPPLEHLALNDWSNTGQLFKDMTESNMDLSHLKTLCISGFSVNGLNDAKIRSMLQRLPQNNVVESLNIWYPIYLDFAQELHVELGIASLPRLRCIRISGQLYIVDLTAIMRECAPHSTLKGIVFEVNIARFIDRPNQWPSFCSAVRSLSPGSKVDLLLVQTNHVQRDGMSLRQYKVLLDQSADIKALVAEGLLSVQEQSPYTTLANYTEPYLGL